VTTLDNAGPLLETKLYVPRLRRGLVARPRLIERMRRGAESKLTLISAPAGFGKTTLLAEWLAAAPAAERSAAWVSLDQDDNQPVSFWTYVITALQTVAPGVGARALSQLQGPPPPIETFLATLLNELTAAPNDVVLVLDDYHVIDAPDIDDGMAFLLDHLPPQVHVVITTRADPPLPLARLRARGELVEIRAADLRFTPQEAAAYLNDVMGLGLAAGDVATLEGRTEGWIAALQLAALSMQGRDDVAGFIAGFAGDDRYIVDYLVEEVLQRVVAEPPGAAGHDGRAEGWSPCRTRPRRGRRGARSAMGAVGRVQRPVRRLGGDAIREDRGRRARASRHLRSHRIAICV
jgi:LuxR family maltose regulon positive regulatory protein